MTSEARAFDPSRRFDIVAVGESMIVLSPIDGQGLDVASCLEVHVAGAESNVARILTSLGHRAAWVSRLGTDPFGQRVLEEIGQTFVDVSSVVRDSARPTGIYVKEHRGLQAQSGGSTSVHYYRTGSAAAALSSLDVEPLLGRAKIVHVTGVTAALSDSCRDMVDTLGTRAREAGALLSFDVNYRPSLWSHVPASALLALARTAHVVFVGLDEAQSLWGSEDPTAVRGLLPDVPQLVVKDSDVGVTAFVDDARTFVPAPTVRVVEPVGAGDAFAGGYLAALLRGADVGTRLRWGHLVASAVLRDRRDHTAMPPVGVLGELASLTDEEWGRLVLNGEVMAPNLGASHPVRVSQSGTVRW